MNRLEYIIDMKYNAHIYCAGFRRFDLYKL